MSADIETLLYTSLTGYAGLAALISARVYPFEAPGGATYPCVVYQRISSPKEETLTRAGVAALSRFQFTILAETASSIRSVATQLKAAIRALVTGVVTIFDASIDDERDLDRTPGAKLWARAIDALILHSE